MSGFDSDSMMFAMNSSLIFSSCVFPLDAVTHQFRMFFGSQIFSCSLECFFKLYLCSSSVLSKII